MTAPWKIAAQKIPPPSSLQSLGNILGVNALHVAWSHEHTYNLTYTKWQKGSYDPEYEKMAKAWAARSDPLWWHIYSLKKVNGSKAIVRRWLIRRAKVAFIKALNEKGYAKDGSRLPGQHGTPPAGDLVGSIQFLITKYMINLTTWEVEQQARLILDALEKKLQNPPAQPQQSKLSNNDSLRRSKIIPLIRSDNHKL